MSESARRRDIEERTFRFACRVVTLSDDLVHRGGVAALLGRQLAQAATSVGANLEEAIGAQSKPDFIAKTSVALKESREAHYWLRLVSACVQPPLRNTDTLLREAWELVAIITAIVRKARSSPLRG